MDSDFEVGHQLESSGVVEFVDDHAGMMMMILVYLRSSLSDKYKDRSPGLHMRTLPPLGPSSRPPTPHQNFKNMPTQIYVYAKRLNV